MKYKIDEMISINNKEWRIAEYRMGRGKEWVYTLSHEATDGILFLILALSPTLMCIDTPYHTTY